MLRDSENERQALEALTEEKKEDDHEQENFSAEQPQKAPHPWLSGQNADKERAGRHQPSPGQGTQAADRVVSLRHNSTVRIE